MWKPGQIVTVLHKRYRVKKVTNSLNVVNCEKLCSIWKNHSFCKGKVAPLICYELCFNTFLKNKLSNGLYLEEINVKTRSNQMV